MPALPNLTKTPSPNYSSRGGQRVRLIVAHDCEGSYAGSINWFAQAQSRVSAHVVLSEDGLRATQMVAWGNKAWHACNFNPFSEGIEAAGYAKNGFSVPELEALASLVAFRLHTNGIPCQEATADNDWTGFTEHWKLGAAGGGHSDFTTDSKEWAAFAAMVHVAYALPAPETWDTGDFSPVLPKPPDFKPSGTTRHDEIVGSIAWVQMHLNSAAKLGAWNSLTVDGIDGPATERELRRFQKIEKLVVDGIVGPMTIAALEMPKYH